MPGSTAWCWSAIGASDDHRSHPGQPHFGLAAVTAPELTREAIFDGLYERRSYATTGARILLDFRVNDAPMGAETSAESQEPVAISAGASDGTVGRIRPTSRLPRLSVSVHGTDIIESVEVLRYSEPDGGFTVIADFQPNALDFDLVRRRPQLSGRRDLLCAIATAAGRFAVARSWRGRARSGSRAPASSLQHVCAIGESLMSAAAKSVHTSRRVASGVREARPIESRAPSDSGDRLRTIGPLRTSVCIPDGHRA